MFISLTPLHLSLYLSNRVAILLDSDALIVPISINYIKRTHRSTREANKQSTNLSNKTIHQTGPQIYLSLYQCPLLQPTTTKTRRVKFAKKNKTKENKTSLVGRILFGHINVAGGDNV